MVHDKCYAHVNRDECKTWLKYRVYTTKYTWKLQNGEIVCSKCMHNPYQSGIKFRAC